MVREKYKPSANSSFKEKQNWWDLRVEVEKSSENVKENLKIREERNSDPRSDKEILETIRVPEIKNVKLVSDKVDRNFQDNLCRWPNPIESINDKNMVQNFPTAALPFGMIQTPFQIMSNWPFKFKNNKSDNPAEFLDNFYRFKRGYKISNQDILENLDALFLDDALEWYKLLNIIGIRWNNLRIVLLELFLMKNCLRKH